jgi:hypothetical protein
MASMVVEFKGLTLEVWYDYFPFIPGSTEGGQKLEPDEPESVEVFSILHNGDELWEIMDEKAILDLQQQVLRELKEARDNPDED